MKSKETPMSICIRAGYKIYPVLRNNNWYIDVHYKGKLIRKGTKSVGVGLRLSGKIWVNSIEKAFEHYSKKILDEKV